MKKTFEKHQKRTMYSLIASIALTVVIVVWSCEKQEIVSPSNLQNASSSQQAGLTVSKKQALARINAFFKNELYPIKFGQVEGINKQQFLEWLRKSKVAAAEKQFLGPLLSASATQQFVLLHNVIVRDTGFPTTIALIAVPPQLYGKYTQMVVVSDYVKIDNGVKTICMWKKCDSYSPCPCIDWLGIVSGTDCPSDKCTWDGDCRGYSGSDCNGELSGIKTIDVISAW